MKSDKVNCARVRLSGVYVHTVSFVLQYNTTEVYRTKKGGVFISSLMLALCICSAAVAGILSLFAMVANGVLIYVIYKDPLNCFRKPMTVLIAALAINDFLTGSVIGTFHVLNEISCETGVQSPSAKGTFETVIGLFALNNTTFLVMGLSGERLIAVTYPFHYRARASGRKTLACVVCIVLYSFVFCLLQVINDISLGIYNALQLHLNMTFPLVAVLIANFVLLRVLRGYRSRRRACSMSSDGSDSYFSTKEKMFEIEKQFASTAILIVIFLVISHAPYYLMTLIEVHCSDCIDGDWFVFCQRISLPFLFINPACNPFIYTFRIRQCRRSLKVLFFKWQETVDVSPRPSHVVTGPPARNAIVLRKISRMCSTTGQFVEEFKEENLSDYFDLGIDNLANIDANYYHDVFETKAEEKQQELQNGKTLRDSTTNGTCMKTSDIGQEEEDNSLVYDTKL